MQGSSPYQSGTRTAEARGPSAILPKLALESCCPKKVKHVENGLVHTQHRYACMYIEIYICRWLVQKMIGCLVQHFSRKTIELYSKVFFKSLNADSKFFGSRLLAVKGVVLPCLHVLRCGQPAAALEVPHNWWNTFVVVGGGVAVWFFTAFGSSHAMFGDKVVARPLVSD